MSFTSIQKKKLEQYLKFVLPTLESNEVEKGYIFTNNPTTSFEKKYTFNTYQEGLSLIEKLQYNNCYIGLSTIVGENNKTENIVNRSIIVIDIDEEGIDISDIYARCKRIGLFAHLVVNSGRGWHIYLKLDNCYDILDIVEVNKKLAELFNSDTKACLPTQVIRLPYTKNHKVNKLSSIVNSNTMVMPYSLSKLKNHKIVKVNVKDTDLDFNTVNDFYCVNQLIKNGASVGDRNECIKFIITSCKYANLTYNEALQKAYAFNDSCKEPQTKQEVIKVAKSIYDNISIIKPCRLSVGQKFCSSKCKAKITSENDIIEDVLKVANNDLDNDLEIGFTEQLFSKNIKVKRTVKKVDTMEKGTMLSILKGTEILLLSELKIFANSVHTIDELVEKTNLSKPTCKAGLTTLVDLKLVNSTKQQLNGNAKPSTVYYFNYDSVKRYSEILTVGRGLFICRINKLITDRDMKVFLALKYLHESRQNVTQLDIQRVSGIEQNNISLSIKNLEKRKLITVEKIKTERGYCNSYTIKM